MENGVKMVSAALLGVDTTKVTVNKKEYTISSPTIKVLAGAGYYLSELTAIESSEDVIKSLRHIEVATKALSWFIQGDEGLSEELMQGTIDEIVQGLQKAIQLIDVRNFIMLSTLSRNVGSLIAKQR